MDVETIRDYCLTKFAAEESFPFDEDTLVFKVGNKIFALIPLERQPPSINLKCDPEYALKLRDAYPSVLPGYHMNKRHWNTILLEGELEEKLVLSLIDHSYDLIRAGLPGKMRAVLDDLQKQSHA